MVRGHAPMLGLVTVAALAVGACSNQAPTNKAPPSASRPSTSPTPSSEPPTSSSEQPTASSEQPPASTPQMQPFGRPFDFTNIYANGTESNWRVTLTRVKCGLKSVPSADSNPKWDGSDSIPSEIDAKVDPGNDFCVLHWDWRNVGTKPATTTHSGNLLVGQDEFAPSDEDQMRSWTMMRTLLGVEYSKSVNPHGTTQSLDVYQIPAGQKPTAVWFPMQTLVGESTILVDIVVAKD